MTVSNLLPSPDGGLETHGSGTRDRTAQGWLNRSIPLGVWLALASATILGVFLYGNYLAQRSTRVTTQNVSHVERRYEPMVRLARDLERAVGAFDRAVLGSMKLDASAGSEEVSVASRDLLAVLDEYRRVGEPLGDGAVESPLRADIEEFHRNGFALLEQQKQRQVSASACWSALNRLRARVLNAGGNGVPVGNDVMFARGSLNELSRSLATMRDSTSSEISQPWADQSTRAEKDESAFRSFLRQHDAEFRKSPGVAWLELVQEDVRRTSRERRTVASLDRKLDESRQEFAAAAARLQTMVHQHLQEPAWQALRDSARTARVTAQGAEHLLFWFGIVVLAVIVTVSLAAMIGVAVPVRRLIKGTRKLAAGALGTRVPSGGVRELDELANAFNHMAEQLSASEQTVRTYQARLEDRVAERTRQLRHLAHHDPLTELPNRRQLFAYLNATVERSRAAGKSIAVLFVDLDNFKTINDSLGHEYGDAVLRAVAERLRSLMTSRDFIARFGGDEFTLVWAEAPDLEAIEVRLAGLIAEFQKPLTVGLRELLVGTSLGVALCPDHGTDAESLLRAADAALFRAKEQGRNRFCVHSPEMLAAASSRFRTEQALRKAVEAGELELHFQPEISPDTLETTVAEALLRWRQADGSVLSAGQFLSIAEQSGLILELNEWVLKTAAAQLREWRAGLWPNARIAVNASSQQFLTGSFVANVEKLLRDAGLPPECLELELTETVLQTGAVTVETLHALRLLGVTVALDDFGTGYSSLTSLEQLPLNRVKLDRSLIADVDTNPRVAAIARSIFGLCRSLGLQVTAEGVERQAQLEFLAGCGDMQVQGYLIARPLPAKGLLDLVQNGYPHIEKLRPPAAPRHPLVASSGGTVTLFRPRTG
jgi:diguanylate cyclase (GGDEF)-like protein